MALANSSGLSEPTKIIFPLLCNMATTVFPQARHIMPFFVPLIPDPIQFDISLVSTASISLISISFVGNPNLHVNLILPSAINVVIFPKANTTMKTIIGAMTTANWDIKGVFTRLVNTS